MTRTLTLLTVLALGASVIAQQPPAEAAKALAPFQGRWVISAINGKSVAAAGTEIALTITGDTYAQIVDGKVAERGTLKIDTAKKPMTIDLTIKEGDDAGKPQVGLVEVSGDTMTLHLSMPGSTTRPPSLALTPGFVLFTARKAK